MYSSYNVDDAWLQARVARTGRVQAAVKTAAIVAGLALVATLAYQATAQPAVAQFAAPAIAQAATAVQAVPLRQARGGVAAPEFLEADLAEYEEVPQSVYTMPLEGSTLSTLGGFCFAAGFALLAVTGVVKWFNSTKGYGFITPDEGGEDIFVHQTAINSDGFRTLEDGARVEYDVVTENGKVSASNVCAPGGAPIQASARSGGGGGGYGKGGGGGGYGKGGGKGGRRQDDEDGGW